MSDKSTNRKINIWINGRQVENTYRDITNAMRKARNELANMTIGSKEYIAQTKKIRELDAIMKNHWKQQSAIRGGWAKIKNELKASTLGMIGGITALIGIARNAFNIFNSFGKSSSKLAGILGETKEGISDLTEQAKELGASSAYTASQVLELQTELAKLGFSQDEILRMSESTLNAAAAMGSELGEQAALTGAVLRSFNKDASEAAHVNDVLAKATTKTALDFGKLETMLPIVSATAKTAGVSLERLTALLGTMADRGVDASTAATSLRNIFLELAKKGMSWDEAMQQINNSTNKNATAMELFGVRSATAAQILAITSNNAEEGKIKFDDLEKSLINADGAAKKLADTMLDNLAGDVTKAKSAWEGFVLSVESGNGVISKVARAVTGVFTDMFTSLRKLNEGESLLLQGMKDAHDFEGKLQDKIRKFDMSIDIKAREIDRLNNEIAALNKKLLATRGNDELQKQYQNEKDELKKQLEIIKTKNFEEERNIKITSELNKLKYQLKKVNKEIAEEESKSLLTQDGIKIAQMQWRRDEIKGMIEHIEKLKEVRKEEEKTAEIVTSNKKTKTKGNKDEKNSLENLLKKYKELSKTIAEMHRQLNLSGADEETKEISSIYKRYNEQIEVVENYINELETLKKKKGKLNDEELDLLNKFYEQREQLAEIKEREILSVELKYAEKRKDAREKVEEEIQDILMSEKDKEIKETAKRYQELIDKAKEYGIGTAELYLKMHEEIKDIQDRYNEKDKDILGFSQEQWDKFYTNMDAAMQIAGEITDIVSIFNQRIADEENAKLQQYEENNERKKDLLKERLDKGLISEKYYNQQIKALDADLDKEKAKIAAKQARREKEMQKYSALLNMFSGLSNIWAAWLPKPGGVAIAGILSALLLVKTGAQIQAINSQPIPKFAKGARVNQPTTALIGEAGPEIVLSSKIVQSPTLGPIADDLARIQEGKRPNFLQAVSNPKVPNYAGMQKAIENKNTSTVTNNTVINNTDNKSLNELKNRIAELTEIQARTQQSIENLKYLRAVISYDDMAEFDEDEKLRMKYSAF